MVRLKKVVAACCAVVALTGMAFASGTKDASAKGTADAPYELTWYMIGKPMKDTPMVMEKVNAYTKEKLGVTLNMIQIDWGDYSEKMRVVIASGQPYDISFTASWAANYTQYAQRGAYLALDDLLAKYGKDVYKAVNPSFWEGAKVDGKIYAIPANKELGQQEFYIYNKRLVDKYKLNIDAVHSLEDLEPLLETIKKNESDIIPYTIHRRQDPFLPFDLVLGEMRLPVALWMDGSGTKVFNPFETPEMRKRLETLRRYYEKGYIPAEAPLTDDSEGFNSNLNTKWFVRRAAGQPYVDTVWSNLYTMPVVSKPINPKPYINTWAACGSMQAISVTSKNPQKAMEFLNLLNTDPYLRNLLAYGIEGVHYETLDANHIKLLPRRSSDYDMPNFAFGNIFITKLMEGDPDDKWAAFDTFNNSGLRAPSLGFIFDNAPVRTELAAIQNVSDQYLPSLRTGGIEVSTYLDEYNRKLKEAGLDTVLAEVQRQYDAWRAAKK